MPRLTQTSMLTHCFFDLGERGSTSQHFEAQSAGRGSQILIPRGMRQALPLSQFEISGVIRGKRKAFSEAQGRGPCLIRRFIVELDRQRAQKPGQTTTPWRIEASASLGDEQPVQGFERPQPGSQRARFPTYIGNAAVAGVRASSKHQVSATGLSSTKLTSAPHRSNP